MSPYVNMTRESFSKSCLFSLMSYVLCLVSYVLCLMSYVFCLISYVLRFVSQVIHLNAQTYLPKSSRFFIDSLIPSHSPIVL